MSSRLVGQVLEHYHGAGNDLLLAIVIADEADHNGGNVRATLPLLAKLSRQTEVNARRLLRKMEQSGWLECVERSVGGRNKPSEYCINQDWVKLPMGWLPKPKQPQQPEHLEVRVSAADLENNVRVSDPCLLGLKALPPVVPHFELTTDTGNGGGNIPESEDERLARWMLVRLRTLNPRHREPKSWTRWIREIRLLRTEVRGLTHREIAAVFKWANEQRAPKPGSDFCWARVILSPANLRAKWERLRLECEGALPPPGKPDDGQCQTCHEKPATLQMGRGPRLCRDCFAAAERAA